MLTGRGMVDTFIVMTKTDKHAQPQPKTPPARWRGDAVEERPGGEAERAAERAEGNTPVSANAERKKVQEPPDPHQQPQRVQRTPQDTADPEQEIAEIADEHQQRRDAGERPPRGKL